MDTEQQPEAEHLQKEEAQRILKQDAERVIKDLIELGCSQKPTPSPRHKISGRVKFSDVPCIVKLMPAGPDEKGFGKIGIEWNNAPNTGRAEEIARQIHDVLSVHRFSGVHYNPLSKTMSFLLNDTTKAAVEELDQALKPLREAIPARVITAPGQQPDKVNDISPGEKSFPSP